MKTFANFGNKICKIAELNGKKWMPEQGAIAHTDDNLVCGDWSLAHHTKLMSSVAFAKDMPIQISLRLSYKGVYVSSWAAGSQEDVQEMVQFWLSLVNNATEEGFKVEDALKKEAEAMFKAL